MRTFHNSTAIARFFAADAGASTGATVDPVAAAPFEYTEQREFYEPSEITKAEARAAQIAANLKSIKVLAFEQDWPEGAGVQILPLARNEKRPVMKDGKPTAEMENYRKTHAIVVWPYWPLEAVMKAANGEQYIRSLVQADQAATTLNPFRRQNWDDGAFDPSACPTNLQDHIEGMRGDRGIIAPYIEACKKLLPQLKEKSPAFAAFTPQYLRTLLQSAPMAKQLAPKLEERGIFKVIIDKLEAITKAQGGNVEIYTRWRDTRDQETEVNLDTLDLDDLKTVA